MGGRIVEIKRQFKRSFSKSDQGIVGGETCFLDKVDVCHVPRSGTQCLVPWKTGSLLGGGSNFFLFSPLFGEDSHFD